MTNVSRTINYWIKLIIITIEGTTSFIIHMKDELLKNIISLLIVVVLSYYSSSQIIQITKVNQYLQALGNWLDIISTIIVIPIVYFLLRLIFISPIQLYYQVKLQADIHNWEDVNIMIIKPKGENQLGWGMVIGNNKLTEINNLSLWITEVYMDGIKQGLGEEQRIGFVKNYSMADEPIFTSTVLEPGKKTFFIIANYDNKYQQAVILSKDSSGNGGITLLNNRPFIVKLLLKANYEGRDFKSKELKYRIRAVGTRISIEEYKAEYSRN